MDEDEIAALEPSLAGRFRQGLFFPQEAHLDPREVLQSLKDDLSTKGVTFIDGLVDDDSFSEIIDCTGAARIGRIRDLRGVRGEMLYLQSDEIVLSRPVRLLHPRFPVYIVPRGEDVLTLLFFLLMAALTGNLAARQRRQLGQGGVAALQGLVGQALVRQAGATGQAHGQRQGAQGQMACANSATAWPSSRIRWGR